MNHAGHSNARDELHCLGMCPPEVPAVVYSRLISRPGSSVLDCNRCYIRTGCPDTKLVLI